ncbi:transmembrane protein, putative [Actinidia rufa]|uniref:Transmembrane protein, putative n=1 Tax=Actinidia rufa TaxID=165716 RepID=A0A7J0H8R8_9ERIC|nr:transmembrane protein, putative [Actinidia rufa]
MSMLDNQIPLFLLRRVLEFQFSSLELASSVLLSILMGLCKELSPFKMMDEFPNVQVADSTHLLDFLYSVIVPKSGEQSEINEVDEQSEGTESKERSLGKSNRVKKLIRGPPPSRGSQFKWRQMRRPRCIEGRKKRLKKLSEEAKPENGNLSSNNNINRPPLVEEITIPSVSELPNSGVHFLPTNGSIMTINFGSQHSHYTSPTVGVEVNIQVILRNLVAYDACIASVFSLVTLN